MGAMNRKHFHTLAEMRVKEAKILLDNRCYQGAYYLAGYSVECAIKACICRNTKRYDFPPERKVVDDIYKHDINTLIAVAGLQVHRDEIIKSDELFAQNYGTVKDWREVSRYDTRISAQKAKDLYNAIADPAHGVLPWLMLLW